MLQSRFYLHHGAIADLPTAVLFGAGRLNIEVDPHRKLDVRGAGLAVQPGCAVAHALSQRFPMLDAQVVGSRVDPGTRFQRTGIIFRGDLHPDSGDVFIRQGCKAREAQAGHAAQQAAPAYLAAQDTTAQVQSAPVLQDLAALKLKALNRQDNFQLQPVGGVGQLGENDRRIVKNPMQEGGPVIMGIQFFKGTPGS